MVLEKQLNFLDGRTVFKKIKMLSFRIVSKSIEHIFSEYKIDTFC
jgi:hypothetical protein